MATNDDLAFPVEGFSDGMKLRDYMAAKAMQAQISNQHTSTGEASIEGAAKVIAKWSYIVADAMLSAREVKP